MMKISKSLTLGVVDRVTRWNSEYGMYGWQSDVLTNFWVKGGICTGIVLDMVNAKNLYTC